jgi:hypothetical protein
MPLDELKELRKLEIQTRELWNLVEIQLRVMKVYTNPEK